MQRYEKLLDEMKHADNRNARFVSVIALCDPEGRDVTLPRGMSGNHHRRTYGRRRIRLWTQSFCMPRLIRRSGRYPSKKKIKSGHRARALEKLQRFLNNQPCQIENDLLCAQIVDRGAEIRHLTQKSSGKRTSKYRP